MNISSKDIKKRDFKKGLRGYDANEVDAFLDTVSVHYEKLVVENKTLFDKVKVLSSDIEIYKENESNLQKAIVKTQEIADEMIQNAKKKSEMIIKEAELNARSMRQDIGEDIIRKKQELEDIKLRNDKLVEDVRMFLLDKLNDFEDFLKNKKIFKMELASLHDNVSHEEDTKTQSEEDKKSELKKVYINPANKRGSSFDDNFEVK